MKKIFAVMLIPFFCFSLPVVSTEKTIALTNKEKYQLTSNGMTKTTYFSHIPTNPILIKNSDSYKDSNLTIPLRTLSTHQKLTIVDLIFNNNNLPVFKLSDGSYIEANRQFICDDVVFHQKKISKNYWLKDHFKVYQKPYVIGIEKIKSKLEPYSAVTVTQKASTYHGTFYKVDGVGWISESDLSTTDNRMEKVQQVLNQKYNKSNYSIYVKQLSTQATSEINADTEMYSASVTKLATLYYVDKKIKDGSLSESDALEYSDAVNHFSKAYEPSGSGEMSKTADNKSYTIRDLLKAVAQHSDNVAANILGYYVANQYDDAFNSVITNVAGTTIDMKTRNMSSKTAGNLMEAIYRQDGNIVSYLSSTDFDTTRISRDIDVPVAHKIGDAFDYKHDVAIVCTKKPFILSIFTNNASYDDISNIADDVYNILK